MYAHEKRLDSERKMKDRGHNEREIERGREFFERIIHSGEFGEENVDEVDEEWEEFERVLRCVELWKNTN